MEARELKEALDVLGMSQADLARALSEAHGKRVQPTVVWRYTADQVGIPAGVAAYVQLLLQHKDDIPPIRQIN